MNQRTLVMLKPDALKRGLVGQIISRIEDKGFKIAAIKTLMLSENIVKEHYAHHGEKSFFGELTAFMLSGPVMVMIVEGESVIEAVRTMVGSTKWHEALPGTIRGDYANSTICNLIDASDTSENAEKEIKRFFE